MHFLRLACVRERGRGGGEGNNEKRKSLEVGYEVDHRDTAWVDWSTDLARLKCIFYVLHAFGREGGAVGRAIMKKGNTVTRG
jgi:hypothetical protein